MIVRILPKMTYLVVVFEETNEVGVVSFNWMKGKDYAYWPPFKSADGVTKAIQHHVRPNPEFWESFKVRPIAEYGK